MRTNMYLNSEQHINSYGMVSHEEIVLETHRIMIEKYGGRLGFERGTEAFKHILADVKIAKGIYRKAAILLRRLVTDRIFKDGS